MGSSEVELVQVSPKNCEMAPPSGLLSVIGEASRVVPPDQAELICILNSKKGSVKEVRESIDRRKDYMITQARKAGIENQKDIKVKFSIVFTLLVL